MALRGLFVMNNPHSRRCFNPHFTEEETKAQGAKVIMVDTVGAQGDISHQI